MTCARGLLIFYGRIVFLRHIVFFRSNFFYSHQEGSLPDALLDVVDGAAKTQALQQLHPMAVGYKESLWPSQPSFSKDGVHWHDASTVQDRCSGDSM